MRDLFDDFLRELSERQAQAQGRGSQRPAPGAGEPPDDEARDDEPPEDEAPGGVEPGPDEPADADVASAGDDGGPAAEGPGGGDAGEPEEPEEEPRAPEPIVIPSARRSGGSGGRRPPRRPVGGPNDGGSWRERFGGPQVLLVVVGLVLFATVFLVGIGLDVVTDAMWYQSIGFDAVFWTRLGAQVGLFAAGLVVALAFLLLNLWLAGRLAPPPDEQAGERVRGFMGRIGEAARSTTEGPWGRTDPFGGSRRGPGGRAGGDGQPPRPTIALETEEIPDLSPLAIGGLAVVAVLAALGTAGALAGSWDTILLYANRVPYDPAGAGAAVDPVFGRDISYYFFELPFLRLVQVLLGGLLIGGLLVAGGRYLLAAARGGGFPTPVRVHLGVLGGLYLLTVAAGYQLDKLELVYSTRGVATGVSYTDQAAQFFAFDALTIVAGVVAALLVGGAFTRWVWPLGAAVVAWFGLSILLGSVYPEAIQRFTVDPNQFAQEEPYIANNLAMTRLSFDLLDWEDRSYRGDTPLTAEDVREEAATFKNARLWDYRPLQTTLDQIQTVRQYYDFVDVDVDRYPIGGETRQVMLSVRELAPERNPQAGSWVNQRIVYTHGFGITMVPVNEVDSQGLPRLIIRDLPPVASDGAPEVTEPRVYFGERPNDWVIVGARQAEFDYPIGSGDGTEGESQETFRWTGTTGISLDSLLTRLLFAARFRDLNLLITDQVTSSSQLLMHRSLGDRLPRIAPFLAYDKDPYVVVDEDGRLVYIQDAYTVTDRFPNAQSFDGSSLGADSGLSGTTLNYIRNSVKIVMDAYDGTMTFYVADPADPLIRAWQGVFPELFRPLDELPTALRPHLRVPEELFNVQTRTFARYHVTDPLVFFQGDDLWTVPQVQQAAGTNQLPQEAYYVYMRMPGEAEPEFLLLQPMVPAARPNMIAWVAARNDGDVYGNVRVYRFPRDTSVFGPVQIEARIDQDPIISAQVSLWSQAGSQVIRGNLIVIPVQDSIIYLEPIYLQSTGSAIPEFTKIVVASPTKVVWGDTLEQALTLLLAQGPEPGEPGGVPTPRPSPSPGASPAPTSEPGATPLPGDVEALVRYANEQFELAQEALRRGDFAAYGDYIAEVERTLAQLEVLIGGSPTPVP
jgi:uncharacterized membrane protein (UPF0182 family)